MKLVKIVMFVFLSNNKVILTRLKTIFILKIYNTEFISNNEIKQKCASFIFIIKVCYSKQTKQNYILHVNKYEIDALLSFV